jgi:hypothetical protein
LWKKYSFPSLARMKPNPLSLTSRLIVPFIGAIANLLAIHRKANALQQDVIAWKMFQRLPEDRSALDERRLVYVRNEPSVYPFWLIAR